mgnify:CR=1 FL=1
MGESDVETKERRHPKHLDTHLGRVGCLDDRVGSKQVLEWHSNSVGFIGEIPGRDGGAVGHSLDLGLQNREN